MSRLVMVMVGTDHHPFDRLVHWADVAAARHPEHRFLVQHGASRAPAVAEGVDYVGQAELGRLLREAAVMICHGGPGTIMDAREHSLVPICVARDPERGEHVDGHQLRFAATAGRQGLVRHVRSAEAFEHELADALAGVPGPRGDSRRSALSLEVEQARARASRELDDVMAHPVRRRDLVRRLLRGRP